MKTVITLSLAILLSATTWGGSSPRAGSPQYSTTASTGSVIQFQGSVTRSKLICGRRIVVMGRPGTFYQIFNEFPVLGGGPTLVASGVIPAGGAITQAVFAVGCTQQPHTLRGTVTTRATAPITAEVTYY